MSEILFAREVIRSSWSEPRRTARQHKATSRQKQLVQGLLDPVGGGRHDRSACCDKYRRRAEPTVEAQSE
jgi:hypothetical protein